MRLDGGDNWGVSVWPVRSDRILSIPLTAALNAGHPAYFNPVSYTHLTLPTSDLV